jgi:AraC-like DNA-binding protein
MSAAIAEEASRLTKRSLAETPDFLLETVVCRCGVSGWSEPEWSSRYGIVFVRDGCFRRRVNGRESFVDPTVVYFERPDDQQEIAHPVAGDSCTALYLSEELLASIWGGEPGVPDDAVATEAATDLRHRLLLVEGAAELEDAIVAVAAAVLAVAAPKRVAAGRPRTTAARRRVVHGARELLVENPATNLIELARHAAVSPHHLSRVFKAETGETISRHRNRLRVRLALERIAEGETCLARVAADLGFADQAHLCRVVRREVGHSPARLRERLTAR